MTATPWVKKIYASPEYMKVLREISAADLRWKSLQGVPEINLASIELVEHPYVRDFVLEMSDGTFRAPKREAATP